MHMYVYVCITYAQMYKNMHVRVYVHVLCMYIYLYVHAHIQLFHFHILLNGSILWPLQAVTCQDFVYFLMLEALLDPRVCTCLSSSRQIYDGSLRPVCVEIAAIHDVGAPGMSRVWYGKRERNTWDELLNRYLRGRGDESWFRCMYEVWWHVWGLMRVATARFRSHAHDMSNKALIKTPRLMYCRLHVTDSWSAVTRP